jgi:hypothetical protein
MQVEPNTLFLWPKGQRLTPTQAVMLMLPGGLVRESEEIGSIIEVPDDAEIGFDGQMPDKTFQRILVKLAPGQAVRLHRATQAMMVQPSDQAVVFDVT